MLTPAVVVLLRIFGTSAAEWVRCTRDRPVAAFLNRGMAVRDEVRSICAPSFDADVQRWLACPPLDPRVRELWLDLYERRATAASIARAFFAAADEAEAAAVDA